jgi:hypothetical protein
MEVKSVKTDPVLNHADTDALRQLNQDFVRSVQMSDVRRFDEILATDFLNSNPDGSLVDRTGFLAQIVGRR